MIEIICIKLKFFQKFSFYLVLACQYQIEGISSTELQHFQEYWFSKTNWRRECRFWTNCLWTNYLSTSAHQRRFSDFQLVKPMFLINLQWHLLIRSHSFLINQEPPLQTHGQLRQVDHSMLQGSVHYLQFQNNSYMMLGILELVRGRSQPPVHTRRNWSKEDMGNLQTRARDFNCLPLSIISWK